jgi:hypothetical protein
MDSFLRRAELLEDVRLEEVLAVQCPIAPDLAALPLVIHLAAERKLTINFRWHVVDGYPHDEPSPSIDFTAGPVTPSSSEGAQLVEAVLAARYRFVTPHAVRERLRRAADDVYWLHPSTYLVFQRVVLAIVLVAALLFIVDSGVTELPTTDLRNLLLTFVSFGVCAAIGSGTAGRRLYKWALPRLRSFRGKLISEDLRILNDRLTAGNLPRTQDEQLHLLPFVILGGTGAAPLLRKLAETDGHGTSALQERFGTATASDFNAFLEEFSRRIS